jgi:Tfp pilus assembly protein PilN
MLYPELNLARRPFRDYRLFAALVALLYLGALGVTALSLRGVVRKFSVNETNQARIAELERGIQSAKEEAEAMQKSLAGTDFPGLTGSAATINGLIARRSFGWGRILERLEAALPDDVRLVSLSTGGGDEPRGIRLSLTCLTPARDGLLRTVTALDGDPAFRDILPGSFSDEEYSSSPGKKFSLAVLFVEEAP